MSAINDENIENRNVLGAQSRQLRNKREEPQQATKMPFGEKKRPVLGTINTNIQRVQPPRATKQTFSKQNVKKLENENAVFPKKFSTVVAQPHKQSFVIHVDNEETKTATGTCSVVPCDKVDVLRCAGELQKPALANVFQAISIDQDSGASASKNDSPMVLDTSVELGTRKSAKDFCESDIFDFKEYFQDIYDYLRNMEDKHKPKANYMKKQPDITYGMRSILIDWLVEVGEEYKLQTETLYLATSYIDRFLSCMSVLRGKLQLVATAAMFIASKYEEIYPPDVGEFVYITDDTYTKKQVLRMEHLILKVLSFDLAVPTSYWFIQVYIRMCEGSEELQHLAMYLAELSLLDGEVYLRYLPSTIAASCVALANYTLDKEPWSDDMVKSSGYSLTELRECIVNLHTTFSRAESYPQQAVRDKYKDGKWHQVSLLSPPSGFPF